MDGDGGTVYLICFDRPYRHARHYLGWAGNLARRLRQHRNGAAGARLMQVIAAEGIGWRVVRTWSGTRAVEARLKRWENNRKLCPFCTNGKPGMQGLEGDSWNAGS